ncbi:hypothetical protein J1N35_000811 [Gossypium stocksii]|uniref:Uncharacterized protein n=1 Tax=Gossypium stocksii TaxID=47602 RepID=A0A9D3WJF4_9ROSI|nr:hypothetical protein J1N35_000811 [Gossypium stocksii]
MQPIRTYIKQVQSECTNSTRILIKLKDKMSQLRSMMGHIKRQIGSDIPNNMEYNPQKEGKELVKPKAFWSGKVLRNPKIPTPKVYL